MQYQIDQGIEINNGQSFVITRNFDIKIYKNPFILFCFGHKKHDDDRTNIIAYINYCVDLFIQILKKNYFVEEYFMS